jgi:hypothetical protein
MPFGGFFKRGDNTAQPPQKISRFDPSRRVLNLSAHLGKQDWITLGQLYSGIQILGGNGSGKTSGSGAHLALWLMANGAGFVWMCAKPDEVFLVRKLARAAGRMNDLVIVGQAIAPDADRVLTDEDGEAAITDARFNALDYESKREGGSLSVVNYLAEMYKCIQRSKAEGGGGENNVFWQTQYERLGRYLVDTAKFSGLPLTIGNLRKLQLSAPKSPEQLKDDPAKPPEQQWKENSLLIAAIRKAEERIYEPGISEQQRQRRQKNWESIKNFWLEDWLALDQKPRSTLDVMFAALADAFTVEPVETILTEPTNITPEDVMNGKIVCLNLPVRKFFEPGRMAQFCFKYSFQRSMLTRDASSMDIVPTVLWADEAHNFVASFDREYAAEIRSFKSITCYLEQSIAGYEAALGTHSKTDVEAFLANLQLRIYHQNSSPETNDYCSSVFGTDWEEVETITPDGRVMFSKQLVPIVRPIQFSTLKRGGAANGENVEAYVYNGGVPFNATGKSFLKTQFHQMEYTR